MCLCQFHSGCMQVKIRFDAAEALSELDRLGLVDCRGDECAACRPSEGLARLKKHWDSLLLPGSMHAAEPQTESKIPAHT